MNTGFSRFLSRFARIEPEEIRAVVTAFLLLFCVLGGYFAVRPVRETVGTILGDSATSKLWTWTAVFALIIVPVYGWLVARVNRATLLPAIYGAVALALAATGVAMHFDPANLWMSRVFYVGISVINLMLVSVFWSFLLELFTSEQTRRLFGFIAAGGTTGALVGPFLTDRLVTHIGNPGVLLFSATLFVVAIFCQRSLMRELRVAQPEAPGAEATGSRRVMGKNPFAGIAIVFRSPYLIGIAVFVMLIYAVNTMLYFEQLRLVKDMFADPAQRTQMFARIDTIVQSLTVISQIFLTGQIAQRFGVTALLTLLPAMVVVGFLILAGNGVFVVFATVMILRRWGEYAFIRPGREMLWSRLDTETKYKAKNFIDVPVYRLSDAVIARFQDALKAGGMTASQGAFVGAGIALVWALNGWWLGRRYDRQKSERVAAPADAPT